MSTPWTQRAKSGAHAAALLSTLLVSSAAAELGPAPPDTSFLAVEDAPPVDPGSTEVELTYDYTTGPKTFGGAGGLNDRHESRSHTGTFTLTHGLAPSLDVALSLFAAALRDPTTRDRTAGGVGDANLTVKWRFFASGDDALQLAYRPGLTAPTGDDHGDLAPGQGFWTAEQMLVATWLWERWTVSADASFWLPFGERGDARGFALANLGIGRDLRGWLKPVLELHYTREFVRSDRDPEHYAAGVGLVFAPAEAWRVDLGVRHGFAGRNAARALGVTANVSRTFHSLFPSLPPRSASRLPRPLRPIASAATAALGRRPPHR